MPLANISKKRIPPRAQQPQQQQQQRGQQQSADRLPHKLEVPMYKYYSNQLGPWLRDRFGHNGSRVDDPKVLTNSIEAMLSAKIKIWTSKKLDEAEIPRKFMNEIWKRKNPEEDKPDTPPSEPPKRH